MLNPAYVSMTNALGSPVYATLFNGIGYNVITPGVVPVGLQPIGYVYNVAQYGGVPMTYSPYGIGCYQEWIKLYTQMVHGHDNPKRLAAIKIFMILKRLAFRIW